MEKILIIKLGAKGDVVRTLSILPALKDKYPDSEITWITKENIKDIFENNKWVAKVFSLPYHPSKGEHYNLLINLDVEEEATSLAKEIKADKKLGFYSEDNFPMAFNMGTEYYLNTMFDDELKKKNKKTYQEMIFDASELIWKKQLGEIYLNKEEESYAKDFLKRDNLIGKSIIGMHLGAGKRWPSKAWDKEELLSFVKLAKKNNFEVILFGGPEELEKIAEIVTESKKNKIRIYQNDPTNTNRQFSALVNICDLMICGDSFAMHIALALRKPTIGLFFCTSPDEIEDYGLLKKIVSPMLKDFFPERMNEYSEELTKSIKAEQVMGEVNSIH